MDVLLNDGVLTKVKHPVRTWDSHMGQTHERVRERVRRYYMWTCY